MKYVRLTAGGVVDLWCSQPDTQCPITAPDHVMDGWRQPLEEGGEWRSPVKSMEDLFQRLAERRWEEETRGCVITLADTRVMMMDTSRENRSNMMSHYTAARDELVKAATYWKMLDGWALMNLDEFRQVIQQTHAYVQNCFAREGELQMAIAAAGEETEAVEAMIEAFWPEAEEE
ncbi:MAG TPA: DUF4376 domain-containing protein [Verrucomicrobiae bacterium]